ASGDCAPARFSRKIWQSRPSWKATPQPSVCRAVVPALRISPAKLKRRSVGTLALIPRSSLMGNAALQAAGAAMCGEAMAGRRLRIEVSMSHRHGPTEVIRGALAFGVAAQAALQIPRIPHGGPDRGKNDNTYKCDVNISIIT